MRLMEQIETSTDLAFDGRLRLTQPVNGHRFGHDALLLAAACPAQMSESVVEFGAGIGAAGLAVAHRVALGALTLVEIDPTLSALCAHNAAQNGLSASVVTLDLTAKAKVYEGAGLLPNSADHVIMNPPFDDPIRHRASPHAGKALAHAGGMELLDLWLSRAAGVLKAKGQVTVIHRADDIAGLTACVTRRFGGLTIIPVHASADKAALRLIICARKGSRAPSRLLMPLVLADAQGGQSLAARKILREGKSLLDALAPPTGGA